MDVLGAVRESVLSNSVESVEKLDNGQYYGVAGSVYPSSFLVPYKSQEGKGDFYTLDTVLFFAGKLAKGFTFGEYMRAAKEAGVETIKLVDRKVWCVFWDDVCTIQSHGTCFLAAFGELFDRKN